MGWSVCSWCSEEKPESAYTHITRRSGKVYQNPYCKECKARRYYTPKGRESVTLELNPTAVAWIAGVIEGEGYIRITSYRKGKQGEYRYALVGVHITDEDVVRKLHNLSGVGRFYGPSRPPSMPESHKSIYIWKVTKTEEVIALLKLILPHMGMRRSDKIKDVLAWYESEYIPRVDRRIQYGSFQR